MAQPVVPIPPQIQAEINMIKDILVQIENRVEQAGNLVNTQIEAQRIDLQMQADQTQERLTEISHETTELGEDVVQLANLMDQRLRSLIQSNYNIFNVLSLLAWKQIFFAVYIRSILKILIVLLLSFATFSHFSSWSASQHVAGWAKEYTALHGRAYSDKILYTSLVSAPTILSTGYSRMTPYTSMTTLSDSRVSTAYDPHSTSPPKVLARDANSKSWWWRRLASMARAAPNSMADIQDYRNVMELKEILSSIISNTDQLSKEVDSTVTMSKAAMGGKHRLNVDLVFAEANAEQVVNRLRILEKLVDRSSSLIHKYVNSRAK